MKAFFRKYGVLFSAVWEDALRPETLRDYFMGSVSLEQLKYELLAPFGVDLTAITDLADLVQCVSVYDLFAVYGRVTIDREPYRTLLYQQFERREEALKNPVESVNEAPATEAELPF